MNKELPGYDEAIKLGYSLYCHSGNKLSASYFKESLCLTVRVDGTADLSACYKMVELKVNTFSFPHKLMRIFEEQIKLCKPLN